MIAGIIASICAFYAIEAMVCIATYRDLKDEQRNEEIQREKFEGFTKKLNSLNQAVERYDGLTQQQKLCEEVRRRHKIEDAIKAGKNGVIFVDEKVEQVIQTGPNDYIVKINRRYMD